MRKCSICGNTDSNLELMVKEMMYSTGEGFRYLVCGFCGCLQLIDIPENMSRYYPNDYYSLDKKEARKSKIKDLLKKHLGYHFFKRKNILGFLISIFYRPRFFKWFRGLKLTPDSFILDHGCGRGDLLFSLERYGFNKLYGYDPFLKEEIKTDKINIFNDEEFVHDKKYDLIICDHSFEHVKDPVNLLKTFYNTLSDKGIIILRMPIADKYAFHRFKENWVQIDAPRHMFIYSEMGLSGLLSKFGFSIKDLRFDSNEFQFLGSMQYEKGIGLNSHNSYLNQKNISILLKKVFYRIKAFVLNTKKSGDSGYFSIMKREKIEGNTTIYPSQKS